MDPRAATECLYETLATRRIEAGLPALTRFPGFEPLAREHSAYMASSRVLGHAIPGVTQGVADAAWERFHPKARHTEDVAAAYTVKEAFDFVWGSPGHRRNLLCLDCTHVSIGSALEPVATGPARLFVTWELLSFPDGTPVEIQKLR